MVMKRVGNFFGKLGLLAMLAACSNFNLGGDRVNPNPVFPPVAPDAPAQAPLGGLPITKTGRWSDPQTWPNGQVPRAGDAITIPAGQAVTLDLSPPPMAGLTINGHLVFERQDLRLTSDWIMVHGRLEVGTPEKPFIQQAEIVLTGDNPSQNLMGMGSKVLGVMGGGVLELHGEPRNGWTKLAQTAPRGARQVEVLDATSWRVGDSIVLASTDFDYLQAEVRRINAISNNSLTLDRPLEYMHFGAITFGVDQRGEVGLLSRNIKIKGETTLERGFGGHIMVMNKGWARISGVEVTQMGQRGIFGRYPIHWHMAGDVPGQYVRQSSIHNNFNRCLTIHGTNWLSVVGNVAYNTVGHCYFLEDGSEMGNTLENNLGLSTSPPLKGMEIIPSDQTPATFWITNPYNFVRGNVAAGSAHTGIWYALPTNPTGPSKTDRIWPRRTPLGEFVGNTAHSNLTGLNVDDGPNGKGPGGQEALEPAFYSPRRNPSSNQTDAQTQAEFRGFLAYKNRTRGAWLHGENLVMSESGFADNLTAITLAAREAVFQESSIVGTSENLGQPGNGHNRGKDGSSLPRPTDPLSAVSGVEFYDGMVGFNKVSFINFQPLELSNGQIREASAVSYERFTPWPIDSRNYVSGVRLQNAKAVYLEARGEPTLEQINNDDTADSYRNAVFVDRDGSLSGRAENTVVLNTPFLTDTRCTLRADWNAQICSYNYGRLSIFNLSREVSVAPLTLIRTDSNRPSFKMWGMPQPGANHSFYATVIAQRSYELLLLRSVPNRLRLTLSGLPRSQSVRLAMAYLGLPFVYLGGSISPQNQLEPLNSLDFFEAANPTAFFHDGQSLRIKLVALETPIAQDNSQGPTVIVDICRYKDCK